MQGHVGLNLIDDVFMTYPAASTLEEDYHLRDESRFAYVNTVAAVAGQLSFTRIGVPAGATGRIIVVTSFLQTSGQNTVIGTDTAPSVASNLSACSLDTRGALNFSGIATGTNVASPIAQSLMIALSGVTVPVGIVLTPGNTIVAVCQVANTAMPFEWRWREFKPSDEELRG